MKKILLSLAVAALGMSAYAAPISINITNIPANDIVGTHIDEDLTGEQNVYEQWNPLTSFTAENFTFTFAQNESATAPAIYSSASGTRTLRLYKGKMEDDVMLTGNTMTITAPEGQTFCMITLNNTDEKGVVNVDKGDVQKDGKTIVWTGDATNTVTFTVTANFRINSIDIDNEITGPVEDNSFYSIDFTTSMDGWTIENTIMPEGLNYVWNQDANYGMKASAYVSGTTYASEAWLISPAFDLTAYETANAEFSQATNYFASIEKAKEEATVWVRENGGEWTQLEVAGFPTTLSWTFVDSSVDLNSVCGKANVQLGFRFTSTAEKSGTWEVKTLKLAGDKKSGIAMTSDFNVTVQGRSIVAPEGSQIFSINGMRTNGNDLNSGLYIVRNGNKAVKVIVK